jgi:hypothetical protein
MGFFKKFDVCRGTDKISLYHYSITFLLDISINPLKTKCRPLYLKTKFVPRSKQFSSWL